MPNSTPPCIYQLWLTSYFPDLWEPVYTAT